MLRQAVLSIAFCCGLAAASSAQVEDSSLLDAPPLTREQWKASIDAQKRRIQQMRRDGISFMPQQTDRDEARSRLILEDYSLVFGDIVSTKQGLFRFVGKAGSDRKAEDFVPLRAD